MEVMRQAAATLLQATAGCRDDMHEPEEKGVRLIGAYGTVLDNAAGDSFGIGDLVYEIQEAVIVLRRGISVPRVFNLATLIALARIGARQVLPEDEL